MNPPTLPLGAPSEQVAPESSGDTTTTRVSPTIGYFAVPAIAAEVRADIKRTNYPKYNHALVAAKTAQAVSQVAAGGALPIDAGNSQADGLMVKELHSARVAAEDQQTQADAASARVHAAHIALAAQCPPLSVPKRLGLVSAVILLTVVGIGGLERLLASSFDELLLRDYYRSLEINGAEQFSAEQASSLVLYVATILLGSKALAVLGSWGQISVKLKVSMVAVAITFSACFAAARLSLGFNWTALMISGVECAVLLSYTVFLLALAAVLTADGLRADAYRRAASTYGAEVCRAQRLQLAAQNATDTYRYRLESVRQREDAARRASFNQDLAKRTVEAEALFTFAELISEHADRAHRQSPVRAASGPPEPMTSHSGAVKTEEGPL